MNTVHRTPIHTSDSRYAVEYTGVPGGRSKRLRECENLDHARRVLAGLPEHCRPADIVYSVDGGDTWLPLGGAE